MSALQVLNRITVVDVLKGAEAPKETQNKDGSWEPVLKDGNPVIGPLNKDKPQDLYLLIGKARDSKTGTTQYGDYQEYFGAFEARRICDGKVFSAGRCILPPPTDAVVQNIYSAEKANDPNAEVAFAFIIGTEAHKHGEEIKFRYTCKPLDLGNRVEQDPLASIKAAIEDQLAGVMQLTDQRAEKGASEAGKGKGKAA